MKESVFEITDPLLKEDADSYCNGFGVRVSCTGMATWRGVRVHETSRRDRGAVFCTTILNMHSRP